VIPAHQRGYVAMHVNHLGLQTEKDWDVLKVIEEDDWVLVTNNAIEFRGRFWKHGKWHQSSLAIWHAKSGPDRTSGHWSKQLG